jgi:hypothetical protein
LNNKNKFIKIDPSLKMRVWKKRKLVGMKEYIKEFSKQSKDLNGPLAQ